MSCQKGANNLPPQSEKNILKLLSLQAAGGQVNLPTLHMIGETDKVAFEKTPYQTKPSLGICNASQGDREGNERGVVALLYEVLIVLKSQFTLEK